MTGRRGSTVTENEGTTDESLPPVRVCRSCPEKFVFIESGNTDGWIATDSAVELSR